MSSAFYIPNHKVQKLTEVSLEGLTKLPPRPDFPNKDAMLKWSHDESTNHCYYNLAEPRDPLRRLNTKDNPIAKLHGVVVDYDAHVTAQLLGEAIGRSTVDYPLAYTSKTFSGGARLVWLFEKPVTVINAELAKALLKRLAKEMKLNKMLPGFDEGAFLDPARYFELGTHWHPVNPGARIPSNTVTKMLFDLGNKVDWRAEGGPEIPIEDVAAEVERRWPHRWAGPFAVGAMGVRFWDAKADNPTGCWIRENGVVAFSGEGRFMPWEEVLGREFVKKYEADRIGGAIADSHFDGRAYWIKDGAGRWQDYNGDIMRLSLRKRGLNSEGRRGAMSEVDQAIAHVALECRIDGAFPFLFNDHEIVEEGARRYLNISRIRAKPPADGMFTWGQEFPWIAQYLSGLFREGQLDAFLSWHRHFWFNAWQNRRTKGHALFVVGPAGIGKTLLNYRIIGASVGGFQEATNFLLGKTEFNAPLFESPLATVDDAVATADRRSHDVYSQIVKKLVANPSLTYRRMYANPVTMPYYGRIVVTLNDDPVSIGMLPSTDGSIIDKVVFIKADDPRVDFSNAEAMIARELPYYLAFLRDFKVPANLVGDPRFGMIPYKHETLIQAARAGSTSSEFAELLEMWKTQYFRVEDKAREWSGTSAELMLELQSTDGLKELVRSTVKSTVQLGRLLNQLTTLDGSGVTSSATRTNKGRIYTIAK